MNNNEFKNFLLVTILSLILTLFSIVATTGRFSVDVNANFKSSSGALTSFGSSLQQFFSDLENLSAISLENQKLRAEKERLELRISQLERAEEILKTMVNMELDSGDDLVQVIAPKTTISDGYIYINRGSSRGLSKGDIVVKNDYYIGQIELLGLNYSRVRIVTSVDSNLPVAISNYYGYANGYANITVRIEDIDQLSDIESGEEVKLLPTKESPILGSLYIGKVREVIYGKADKIEYIEVDYPIVLSELNYVRIIRNE